MGSSSSKHKHILPQLPQTAPPDLSASGKAKRDFRARGDGDLSLTAGEQLTLLHPDPSRTGWTLVRTEIGAQGFVPDSCIEQTQETPPVLLRVVEPLLGDNDVPILKVDDVVSLSKQCDSDHYEVVFHGTTHIIPTTAVTELSSEMFICEVKMIATFRAEQDGELDLSVGDTVKVLSQDDDTWWLGFKSDRIGYFPANFAESVDSHRMREEDLRKQLHECQRLYDDTKFNLERMESERNQSVDALRLEQRLRENIQRTVEDLTQQHAELLRELQRMQDQKDRLEARTQHLSQRLEKEEQARQKLQEELIQSDSQLQAEMKNRVFAMMTKREGIS